MTIDLIVLRDRIADLERRVSKIEGNSIKIVMEDVPGTKFETGKTSMESSDEDAKEGVR